MAILKSDFMRWYNQHSMGSKMDVAWAAVKMAEAAEGVQTQPTNNARAEICPLCAYATSVQDTEGCPKCGGTGKLSPVA